jgi:hypothetical protein
MTYYLLFIFRALLDAKKQRLYRRCSSSSTSSSTVPDQVLSPIVAGEQPSSHPPSSALEVNLQILISK